VDYVGGASMGALIGAMYSMGKTPEEIESFVAGLDWDLLLQPSVSFENLSFRRKEDRRNIPSPIFLTGDIKDLKLPNALISGQEIEILFDQLTLPYALVDDFDDLPIPYRAVGTDMVKGSSITLAKGSLSRALRATMSIPGIFAPVEIDGRILSDGGLVNNIPTNVVKEMGADILIAVNIETRLEDRDSLDSLPGILAQTINIATLENSLRSLRQADLIIAPDLGKYTLADFADSREIIKLGYEGARRKASLLQSLSLDEEAWRRHLAERRKRRKEAPPPVPVFLNVAGADANATRTIREKLGDSYTGKPLDQAAQERLAEDLADLKGTGRFESLAFGLIEENGRTGLLIRQNRTASQAAAPTLLELGLDVNSVKSDKVNFDFLARMTLFDTGAYGVEWRNDLRLGSNPLLATEYYRPLGKSGLFISPQASFERRRTNYFVNGDNLAEYIGQTLQTGIDLGYSINAKSELRAGYAVGYQKYLRQIGDPLLGNTEGIVSRAGLSWVYDGLDKAQVPTRGILSRNTFYHYFDSPEAEENFTQLETESSIFGKTGKRNVLFSFMRGGATLGGNASPAQKFTVGGRLRLGGYYYEEFRADNYLVFGSGVLHNPAFFPDFLGGKTYLGAWYEGGSAFDELKNAIYRQSLSGGVFIETPFGPVFVGGSLNEDGRGKLYFSYGRFF